MQSARPCRSLLVTPGDGPGVNIGRDRRRHGSCDIGLRLGAHGAAAICNAGAIAASRRITVGA
jgi:hypothetical protein